jgi:hypothetical protein
MMHKFLVQIDDKGQDGFPAKDTAIWLQMVTATHFALFSRFSAPVSVAVTIDEQEPDLFPVCPLCERPMVDFGGFDRCINPDCPQIAAVKTPA